MNIDRRILLSPPDVGEAERSALLAAFDSGWIAPAGPDLNDFEHEISELVDGHAVVGLSSGTAALHLALLTAGVGHGDEVLVSDLTFAASAFAVVHCGAHPCFVDAEPMSWHLDVNLVADELRRRAHASQLPAAVISVDLYGSVADNAELETLCAEYEVPLIEDAAEALGARRAGRPAGTFGRCAALSFNGNKMVTTGGGGALVTADRSLAERVRSLAMQARQPVPWYEHAEIGFNYRMGNLNAAVGRGQLRTLQRRIERRAAIRAHYEHRLGHAGFGFQVDPDDCQPNYWLPTATIDPSSGVTPMDLVSVLAERGVESRPGFKPMHLQPVFAGYRCIGGSVAEALFDSSISLPSGGHVADDDVDLICDVILERLGE